MPREFRLSDLSSALQLAALAGAGVFVYWLVHRLLDAQQGIGRAAGEALTLLTTSGVAPLGRVALPDGSVIAMADIAAASGVDRQGVFTWNGGEYQLVTGPQGLALDDRGYYVAKRLVT